MSQYDMMITYIHGEDNTVTDALSHLPPNWFPREEESLMSAAVGAVISITTDSDILNMIMNGYHEDEFCK